MGTPDIATLVAYLVAGDTLETIALTQGWDEAATRAAAMQPGVSALVDEARDRGRLRVRLRLESMMDDAASALQAVIDDPESSPTAKVAAAREILSRGGVGEPIPPASPLASKTDDELQAIIDKVTGPRGTP